MLEPEGELVTGRVSSPLVSCPRCSGCGYEEECPDCWTNEILVKRPGCRVCGGSGKVPCKFDHPHPEHPCSGESEKPGEPCFHCDQPIPLDGSHCPTCWTPVPDNLADQKAMFADMGLSLTKQEDNDV